MMRTCETILSARPKIRARRLAAFTLIELLVVIAIVGVLVSIALPVMNSVQGTSRAAKCLGNIKQLGAAAFAYAADNNETLPNRDQAPDGTKGHLYPEFIWSYATTAKYVGYSGYAEPAEFAGTIFHCPELPNDPKNGSVAITALRSYGMNYYMGSGTPGTGVRISNIPHPPTTMLFCDAYNNTYAYANQLAKRHLGNCNVVFCDGHAEKIVPTAAMTGSGGAVVTADPFWGDRALNSNQ